ncbi:hypothetical protein SHIRM173S_01253 [Streptomyces hirsutus]
MVPASSQARSRSSAASITGLGPGFAGLPGAPVACLMASASPALVIANRASRSIHSRRALSGSRVSSSRAALLATWRISCR